MHDSALPERMSITAPLPKWITAGDEIDGQDKEGVWWHAIALESVTTGSLVKVFWVGFAPLQLPPRSRRSGRNPDSLNISTVRSHEDDASVGSEQRYDVAWIKNNVLQIPKTFQDTVNVSSTDSEFNGTESSSGSSMPANPSPKKRGTNVNQKADKSEFNGTSITAKPFAKKRVTNVNQNVDKRNAKRRDAAVLESTCSDSSPAKHRDAEVNGKQKCDGRAAAANADGSVSSSDSSMPADPAASESTLSDSSPAKHRVAGLNGKQKSGRAAADNTDGSRAADAERRAAATTDPQYAGAPPLYHLMEVYNFVDMAIECLVGLDAGLAPHRFRNQCLFDDMASKLKMVASFLAQMYSNAAYNTLVCETLAELHQYAGPQKPRRCQSKTFLKALSQYGFCLSPRMWLKEEILCIAISLLDPRLDFQGIMPKDGVDDPTSFRGMAVLNSNIQQIFYKRLQSYGFVNPRYHPKRLQAFSSVVINGGGSWQQSATWKFCKQTNFQIDTAAVPFIISVGSEVGALEAAGIYVATTTKKNGKPVYAQISRTEFKGYTQQTGFGTCFTTTAKQRVQARLTNTQGKRIEACSPRVLMCMNADSTEWGIQLLPGYGSDLCILKFGWDNEQTSNPKRFSSLNFDTFEAKMQSCSLSIANVFQTAAECLTPAALKHGHSLGFGTSKVVTSTFAKPNAAASFRVSPLISQGCHADGPIYYNDSIFDMFGNWRPDAPACAKRPQWKGRWTLLWEDPLKHFLPDHIGIMQESFSALFGIFKGTAIETPASEDANRHIRVLKVKIPLGCAVVFTFAWKHMGKGDDPGFRPTHECPVPVHARPHFYAYGVDIRKLPTVDCETALEFISLCSQKLLNRGAAVHVLDCLQTFEPSSAPGHYENTEVHELFSSQSALESFITHQLDVQANCDDDKPEILIECHKWSLFLEGAGRVQLRYVNAETGNDNIVSVTISSANFDSEKPSFRDSNDQLYNVVGKPAHLTSFPASTPDSELFQSCTQLLDAANNATAALCEHWCESSLLYLLSVLNTHAITDYTLTVTRAKATQSGYRFVMFLKGKRVCDNSSINGLIRPGCEVTAMLYRKYLEWQLKNDAQYTSADLNQALLSLEQSSGVFNVGPRDVLNALMTRDLQRQHPFELKEELSNFSAAGSFFMFERQFVILIGEGFVQPPKSVCADPGSASATDNEFSRLAAGYTTVQTAPLAVDLPGIARQPVPPEFSSQAATVQTAPLAMDLPEIARYPLPPGIPESELTFHQWPDCNIAGVGKSSVWNVFSEGRVYDSIAVQLSAQSPMYTIEEKTVHYDAKKNQVVCTQVGSVKRGAKRQFVHFENVCEDFRDWAKGKMPRDNEAWHNQYFKEQNLLRVECGGKGNCFYHVCEFLLNMFLPQICGKDMDHISLRIETVNHLRTHHQVIESGHGPVSLLLDGAGDCSNDDASTNAIVAAYCDKNCKVGEYVEDPCVLSFAHLMEIQIKVHHTRLPEVQNYNSAGASVGSLTLWCDGNHYQVTLPKP